MGPWQLRDLTRPFAPGFSYETMKLLVSRGKVTSTSIVRGPTTRQFWTFAIDAPGVAVLLGRCHACRAHVAVGDAVCHDCGIVLGHQPQRQILGLDEIRPIDQAIEITMAPARAPAIDAPAPEMPARPLVLTTRGREYDSGSPWHARESVAHHAAFAPTTPAPTFGSGPAGVLQRQREARRNWIYSASLALNVVALLVVGVVALTWDEGGSADSRVVAEPAARGVSDDDRQLTQGGSSAERRSTPAAPARAPEEGTPPRDRQGASPSPGEGDARGNHPLGPSLASWRARFDAAVAQAEDDTLVSIEGAIAELRAIEQEVLNAGVGEVDRGPLVAKREFLEERRDQLKLREFFNPSEREPGGS